MEAALDELRSVLRTHDARFRAAAEPAAPSAAEIGARRRATLTRMATQDRNDTAAHFAELDRLLTRLAELREEDCAAQERADKRIDAALARLREISRRLAP